MLRIEIDLDEETGLMTWMHEWKAEAQLDGNARVAWLSLHNRYRAIKDELIAQHHEKEARETERLLQESGPKLRRVV